MYKIILSCFLLFFCVSMNAQGDLEIITFDEDDNSRVNAPSSTLLILKTNPISMIYGRQFLEAEYPITRYLTVEGGLGLTFKPVVNSFQNFYLDLYSEIFQDECASTNFSPGLDYCDQRDYGNFDIRNTNIGVWLSSSVKFYLYNDAPSDAYISLNLRYSTNSYEVLQVEEINTFQRTLDTYTDESVRNFDYTVRYGYQSLFSPLTFEYFVGLGIRSTNSTRLDVGIDDSTFTYANRIQNETGSNLILEAGLRLGIELTKQQQGQSSSKKKKRKRRRRR